MKKLVFIFLLCVFAQFTLLFSQAGTLDPTFGDGDGFETQPGGDFEEAFACVIRENGNIIVGGYSINILSSENDIKLYAYLPDGSADDDFGDSGILTTDAGGAERIYAMKLQEDGKIICTGYIGYFTSSDFITVRYMPDGNLDAEFGEDGIVITDFPSTDNDIARAIAIDDEGRIIVAGKTDNGNDDDFGLIRYLANGTLDLSFGMDGFVSFSLGESDEVVYGIVLQEDGKIVVGGTVSGDFGDDFVLVRFESDGTLDNSFGTGGAVVQNVGYLDHGSGILLQPDGKIVICGYADVDLAALRFLENGTPDITFSDDGITTMDFDGAYDFGFACAQQSDGKILVGGFNVLNIADPYPDADFILTRFNVDGTPDLSFGTDAKVKNDFGSLNDYITSIQIQADGKIIAAGCSGIYAEQGFAVARYISGLNVGVLDFVTQDNMLYLYPNPIESNAMLSYTLQNDTHLSIYIIDQQGKKIINVLNNILINKGLQTQQIILPSYLSKGIYHIVLESNEGAISVQFVH